jgi:hypothetical protein
MDVIAIVVGVLVVVGLILVVVFAWVRAFGRRHEQALRERFPTAQAILPANYFGVESKGVAQMRGNGALVLTRDELFFERWVPRMELHIPLSAITAVETVRSHLGKAIARPLLKVSYTNADGAADSVAWYVADAASVKQTLEERLPGRDST